jgi:hypothetical protein
MDLTALLRGDTRSESTACQYAKLLACVYRSVTGYDGPMPNLDWLEEVDSVMELLSKYKETSKKVHIVPLVVLTRAHSPELAQKYEKELDKCIESIAKASKNGDQEKTQREVDNWVTLVDIRNKMRQLRRIIRDKIPPKSMDDRTVDDNRIVLQYLLLNLYTLLNPLRNDYADLRIVPCGESEADQSINVVTEEPRGKFTMTLRQYKTARKYGPKTYIFPKQLNAVITESLSLFPRAYMLSNPTDGNQPMSPDYCSRVFGSIFEKEGKRVGCWLMRKIFLSERYQNDSTLSDRQQIAASMGHSVAIAERVYRRV